jgi:membrane protease YdiL (CAAX protease family)
MALTFGLMLATLCLMALISVLVKVCLDDLGFFSWLYGPEFSSIVEKQGRGGGLESDRYSYWLRIWTEPLQITCILLLIRLVSFMSRRSSGIDLPPLGFSISRSLENSAFACFAWLLITPVVFGVNFLANLTYFLLTNSLPESHPLTQLAQGGTSMMDGVLLGMIALVLAPIWEEFMFRGLLQPWLCQRDWGGHVGMALALLVALGPTKSWLDEGTPFEARALSLKLGPIFFVLVMLPGYFYADRLVGRWIADRNVVRGIYSTALLFGMVHALVAWPTPIPLFFLGVGLGYLAYRTQSLLGPIILHSLFNAVACIALLIFQAGSDPQNGKEATSAGTRPIPTVTSTRVPGSWQLR